VTSRLGTAISLTFFYSVGGVHIGARALLDMNFIWFGYIARLFQLGGGGISFVQMISTCLRYTLRKGWDGGGGVSTLCLKRFSYST
jgi:hypothetical protein